MMNSFFSEEELRNIGFKNVGKNVQISRKASFYGVNQIEIGNNVRIDDNCILSGNIRIGNYVHIAAASLLFAGNAGIEISDYAGLSSRCAIYAESDDYSGNAMTNPTVPAKYRNVHGEKVVISKHVVIGSGCTVLPGVVIGEGTAVGCMSLVNKSLESWGLYIGVPCKKYKDRSKNIISLESSLKNENVDNE